MTIQASSKFSRITPRKMRLVASEIKKLSLNDALERLTFSNKRGAYLLKKVIESAIANAKNNLKIDKNNLFIKQVYISQGTVFKRWKAVSKGAAHGYKKRTSHIKVVLEEMKLIPQIKQKLNEVKEKQPLKVRKNGS